MKNLTKKFVENEDGQAMILFALLMTVLIGFAALVVDVGMIYLAKTNVQTAADAAALAGAQNLPNAATVIDAAKDFAEKNGIDRSSTIVNPAYKGDSNLVEVVCTVNVQFSFARILGFTETDLTARAVAKKNPQWAGEALPFINLDDDYKKDPKIVAWEKTAPGDFESLWPDEYEMVNLGKHDDHSKGYFSIDYSDGIMVTKGTVAHVKQEVGYIYQQHKPVYIFSLSSEAIKSKKYETIKNKDVIPVKDLVLLQVTFDSYDYSGKTLFLTVTRVFDFHKGEFPTDYLNSGSKGTARLVE